MSFLFFFFFPNDQFILLIARTNQKKRREKGDPSNCKVSNLTLFPPMSATHVTYQCKIEERVARHIPGIPHSPSTCTRSYTHTHTRATLFLVHVQASARPAGGIGTARPRRNGVYRRQQGFRGAILSKRDPGQTRKFVRGRYMSFDIFSNGRNGRRVGGWMAR